MYLADNKIIPTREWHHEPSLQYRFNRTVSMLLAEKGIIPPKEWFHDPSL